MSGEGISGLSVQSRGRMEDLIGQQQEIYGFGRKHQFPFCEERVVAPNFSAEKSVPPAKSVSAINETRGGEG